MTSFRLTFLTPLFSRGAYDTQAEVRPPSIRGQLHWWFRALGNGHAMEKEIFGGVHGGATASRIVTRVSGVDGQQATLDTLPHKDGGQASPKACFKPGASFDLHVSERLGGLAGKREEAFQKALETWLLLGTLGLRATRAAGSFDWVPLDNGPIAAPPSTPEAYRDRCRVLLRGAQLRFSLLAEDFPSADGARTVISDTLGGRDDREGKDSLARINHPLGRVNGGRKTSPLRFRIVRFGESYRIAAVWDDREAVTKNQHGDLEAVINLLSKNKRIGKLLKEYPPQ